MQGDGGSIVTSTSLDVRMFEKKGSVADLFPIMPESCWGFQWEKGFNFQPTLEHKL